MISLQEAFSKLNMLESNDFNLMDEAEKDEFSKFLDDSDEVEETDIVDVFDTNAMDETELEDTYVGKIVVTCPVCKSAIFRTTEELTDNEDKEETCPYCSSAVIMEPRGKIVEIDAEVKDEVEDEEEKEDVDVEVTESCKGDDCKEDCDDKKEKDDDKDLKEDLENVTIETENEVINVSSESKDDDFAIDTQEKEEVIAPLDGDLGEVEEDEDEIDEFDEESFDNFAESFFRENYRNVKGYKTTKVTDKRNHAIVEGVVTLKDGKQKLTEFRIRTGKFDRKTGRATCLVENLQLNKKKVVTVKAVK